MVRFVGMLFYAGALLASAPAETNCDVRYGATGKTLAPMFRDALKVLPMEVKIGAGQVVVIKHFPQWAECRGIEEKHAVWVRQNLLAFTVDQDFPIYVVGESTDLKESMELYDHGTVYLRYRGAVLLAHEWVHAYLHEAGEVAADAFGIAVLESYLDQQKLPAQYQEALRHARVVLGQAQAEVRAGRDPVIHALVQGKPSAQ
jgi:hypothetical protein